MAGQMIGLFIGAVLAGLFLLYFGAGQHHRSDPRPPTPLEQYEIMRRRRQETMRQLRRVARDHRRH
jgi:hypothetical protein